VQKRAPSVAMTERPCRSNLACKWIVTHGSVCLTDGLRKTFARKSRAGGGLSRLRKRSLQSPAQGKRTLTHGKFSRTPFAQRAGADYILLFCSTQWKTCSTLLKRLWGKALSVCLRGFLGPAWRELHTKRPRGVSCLSQVRCRTENSLTHQQGTPDACPRPEQFH